MRKWLFVMFGVLIFPWVMSLLWMKAAGVDVSAAKDAVAEKSVILEKDAVGDVIAEDYAISAEDTSLKNQNEHTIQQEVYVLQEKRILIEQNGIKTYRTLEDYLPGMILCQADTGAAMEVLKCQAVIARTYVSRIMDGRTEIDEKELDLTYPGVFDQGILSNMGKRDQVISELKRCEEAVRATEGVVMQYDGRCILPLFHKISAGRTRTGEVDFPYLQSVESRMDTEADGYLTEMEWSVEAFTERIQGNADGQSRDFDGKAEVSGNWLPGSVSAEKMLEQIQIVQKDDSGYILQIKIGAKTCTGEEVQYALGLPSSHFSVYADDGKIHVRVQGVGHGYGLSQAGAAGMAKDGWNYEEILQHYYKNISLVFE